MQPIERYGVVALLFVVIAVVTVVAWDDPEPAPASHAEGFLADARTAPNAPGAADDAATGDAATRRPDGDPRPEAGPRRLPLAEVDEDALGARAGRLVEGASPPPRAADLVRGSAAYAPAASRAEEVRREPEPRPAPREAAETSAPARRADPPAVARREPRDEPRSEPRNEPGGAARRYVVRSGDTLSEIAQRELGRGSRWKEIASANPGIDPLKLVAGAEILLPAGGEAGAGASAATASATAPREDGGERPAAAGPEYVVAKGDSLWRIAERALGDGERWREIPPLNPGLDPNRLKVGARLVLPAGARPAALPAREPEQVARAEAPRRRVR